MRKKAILDIAINVLQTLGTISLITYAIIFSSNNGLTHWVLVTAITAFVLVLALKYWKSINSDEREKPRDSETSSPP